MSDTQRQYLEVSVALEIVKTERDQLRARLGEMQYHLQQTMQRADRMEQRLHAAHASLARLSESLITPPRISSWSEVDHNGHKVLRLDNPVRKSTRHILIRQEERCARLNSL
jgi:hypothetical protein